MTSMTYVQESTIFFELPPTTAAKARAMFKVSDDAKLRVRDPLHKQFGGSKVKASDYVVKVDGNGHDMEPEALLYACMNKDDNMQLTLQRDLGHTCIGERGRERESVIAYVRLVL